MVASSFANRFHCYHPPLSPSTLKTTNSGFYLPYPPTAFGWELSFIFLYAVVEMIRLFQASKGNKTEQVQPLLWSFLLSISIILANSYYLDMQTYVWVIFPSRASILLFCFYDLTNKKYLLSCLFSLFLSNLILLLRMRIDVILNVVSLSFVGLEFILSVVALVAFWSQVGWSNTIGLHAVVSNCYINICNI